MSLYYYEPVKNATVAYHKDGSNNEYYGKAAKGAKTSTAGWTIFKMTYSGSNWIGQYPVDSTTGLASDEPKFIWDSVESYTYRCLGT